MISWIVGGIIVIWCLFMRFVKKEKVLGYPLGMPKGTVRALITLLVVLFPFRYLIANQNIPPYITNGVYILVAFYFQGRKSTGTRLLQVEKQIDSFLKPKETAEKERAPLYLPRYTVRTFLLIILVIITIVHFYRPGVTFVATDTIIELLIIVIFYLIGSFFGKIESIRENKRIKEQIEAIENVTNLSKYIIMGKIMEEKPKLWKQMGRNFFSLVSLAAIVTSLIMYTIDQGTFVIFPWFGLDLTIRAVLLLLINVYFGFRT